MEDKCAYYINPRLDLHRIQEDTMYEHLLSDEVFSFHKGLSNYRESPLVSLPAQALSLGVGSIFVKDESARLGLNSFKILGVSYAVHETLKRTSSKSTVFTTATEGNHGQALARTARLAGSSAVIFVPQNIDPIKLKSIEAEQATVEIVKGDYDDAVRMAAMQAEKYNWTLIQDTSFENYTEVPLLIMAGYTSIFREIEVQMDRLDKKIDFIFIQAGVGSFAASAIYYYGKQIQTHLPQIIIIEPAVADGCLQSAKAGALVKTMNSGNTLMKGLNCRTPSKLAWPIVQYGASAFISLTDREAKTGAERMRTATGADSPIHTGYSGASGLAGLIALCELAEFVELKKGIGLNENSTILVINTENSEG